MEPKSVYFAGFLKNFISAAVILDFSLVSAQKSLPYRRANVKLSRRLRLPEFLDDRHMNVISALRTGRL